MFIPKIGDPWPQNLQGFAEPPLEYEKEPRPCICIGEEWSFGVPIEPGNYEWVSFKHSIDPSRVTVYINYDGTPHNWGRNTWFRKIN